MRTRYKLPACPATFPNMAAPVRTQPASNVELERALAREHSLVSWLLRQPGVLVGFSGGVDSAYLACVAVDALGPQRVLAVIGRSASYPAEQWCVAREVADRF